MKCIHLHLYLHLYLHPRTLSRYSVPYCQYTGCFRPSGPAFAALAHVTIPYEDFTLEAKKRVRKEFIKEVQKLPDGKVEAPSEQEYKKLPQYDLNGRKLLFRKPLLTLSLLYLKL